MTAAAADPPQRRGRRRANGEGSIYQRADGRWVGAYYVPALGGGAVRRYVYGKNWQAAHDALLEVKGKVHRGEPIAPARLTVGEFLDQWLTEVAARRVRAGTFTGYEVNVRLHLKPAIGRKKLGGLTPRDVRLMLDRLLAAGKAEKTVRYVHQTLRTALEHAVREEVLHRNVARLVQPPRRDLADDDEDQDVTAEEIRPFTPEESKRVLRAARSRRLYALWAVLMLLGLRRSEALGLRWSDVELHACPACECTGKDGEEPCPDCAGTGYGSRSLRIRRTLQRVRGRIVIQPPKTKRSRRTIPLPALVLLALLDHRAEQRKELTRAEPPWPDSDLIFRTRNGLPVEPRNVNTMFVRICRRAEVRTVNLHTLRHGTVTLLLSLGVPPHVVMAIAGHTSLEMTMKVYGHVSLEDKRAALDQLNALLGD